MTGRDGDFFCDARKFPRRWLRLLAFNRASVLEIHFNCWCSTTPAPRHIACLSGRRCRSRGAYMFGAYATYVVAISAMVFCAISALTLINTVRHLDSSEARELPETVHEKVAL